MLKFVYGISGSGKTTLLRKEIEKNITNKKKCILIIPEQQAYITEETLTQILPKNAGLFFEVLSFSKLANKVAKLCGGTSSTLPDQGRKTILMWETLRKNAASFKCYQTAAPDYALCSKMLSEIEELRNNGLESQQLLEAAEKLPMDSPLSKKLYDFALVETAFEVCTKEAFGGDEIDRLIALAAQLKEHRLFENYEIFIDSFTSFTAPQYLVLTELLRQSPLMTIALSTDNLFSQKAHFAPLTSTVKRLYKIANQFEIKVETHATDYLVEKPASLNFLAENLWNFSFQAKQRPEFSKENLSAVSLSCAGNMYEESEWAAEKIEELLSKGINCSEIALIVRDASTYQGVLDAALERHRIPFFLAENTDLSSKPLTRLILSALRCVSRNYLQSDVMTLLKTGFAGATLKEVSLFEEYCVTWHIHGVGFLEDVWAMNPDGLTSRRSERGNEILATANQVKSTVMKPLLLLSAELASSNLLVDRCRAIYNYLLQLQIPEQLNEFAKKQFALGALREAEESLRLYQLILELLTGLAELLPKSTLTIDEFISLLTLLFTKCDFGSVPNMHNCVTIGSANTLRVENLQISFLLGLCEGEFPKAISKDGLLTEQEKDVLENAGFSIETKEQQLSREELLFVYRAISKPKSAIYLSYPAMKPDGSLNSPSIAFQRIKYLMGNIKVENATPKFYQPFKEEPKKELLENSGTSSMEKSSLLSNYQVAPMPEKTNLYLSQSSVREFALCPYQYFLNHRLHLREKIDSSMKASDEGSFLHFVFQHFLKNTLGNDGKIHFPENADEMEKIADEIINCYIDEVYPLPPEKMDARLLHLFRRLRILALKLLRDILHEISISEFHPALFEQKIGSTNGLPAIVLTLPEGSTVTLGGTVDRIDFYESPTDGKTYIRVIDYKTGEHKFSIEDVKSGLDIQLVLYLLAVVASDPNRLSPASAQFLYGHKKDGVESFERSGLLLDKEEIKYAVDTTQNEKYDKKLICQTDEKLATLMEDMQTTVKTIAGLILSGEARKTPSENACRYCPALDVCEVAIHVKKQ